MLKKLVEETGRAEAAPARETPAEPSAAAVRRSAGGAPGRSRETRSRRSFLSRRRLNRGVGQGHLARRVRPRRNGPRLRGRRFLRRLPEERSRARRPDHRRARRGARPTEVRGRTLRDVLHRRRVARRRARPPLRAVLLHLRRRGAREGARARPRRGPDGDAARLDVLGGLAEVRRRPADPRGVRRRARTLQPRLYSISSSPKAHARPGVPDRGRGALPDRQAQRPRRRLDLPRRARRAGATAARSTSRRRTGSRCRPTRRRRSSWSGPARASRPSAPSSRSAQATRRRARTGSSSATSAQAMDFLYRDEFTR